jgi:hypothetical protein
VHAVASQSRSVRSSARAVLLDMSTSDSPGQVDNLAMSVHHGQKAKLAGGSAAAGSSTSR